MISLNELSALLKDKSTIKRRSAAKRIQKEKPANIGNELFDSLVKEMNIGKYWETQVEMIKAIDAIQYKEAADFLFHICLENKDYDMVTYQCALTYVRLKRQSLADTLPVFALLKFGKFAVSNGAIAPLGLDRMMPGNEQVKGLIEICWNLGSQREEELLDPRYTIAAACAGWDKTIVNDFLNHCIETGDNHLKRIAQKALHGIYEKID